MKKRKNIKYIHEGEYIAEVEVDLIHTKDNWSPYLSLKDAYKLDDVRQALRNGDLKTASNYAQIFIKQPIAV